MYDIYTINFIWVTMFAKYLKNFSSTRKKKIKPENK